MNKEKLEGIGFFEKYLTIWVTLCIVIGVAIGKFIPAFPQALGRFEYSKVSLPIAVLIWMMIFPMMLKIDFGSILHSIKQPKGLAVTIITNWFIKPFTMYIIAVVFLKIIFKDLITEELGTEYVAGAILLGAAPCTAMVLYGVILQKEMLHLHLYRLQ